MSTIADSPLANKDLAPTGPGQRTWRTDGVFVAFALSAIAYAALMRAQSTAVSPAAATAD
jgi:cytosine/uracil/thiamine/allantoin permease